MGSTVAQRIIDGRPYKSIADVEKVKGLGKTKADALESQITFGSASGKTRAKSSKSTASTQSHKSSLAPTGKIDVNTADLPTLETLSGVDEATARRIIAGRPYTSLNQLSHVEGLNKTNFPAVKNQVRFSAVPTVKGHKAARSVWPPAASSGTSPSSTATASQRENTENETAPLTPTGRSSSSSKLAPGETIDINTASAEELDKLYGIGPTKAQAIIDYRNEHGPFQSTEDIMKVNGIKEGEFYRIKDNITVR